MKQVEFQPADLLTMLGCAFIIAGVAVLFAPKPEALPAYTPTAAQVAADRTDLGPYKDAYDVVDLGWLE